MRAQEFVGEKWSQKYKSSINCANPKGFSQRAHCAGRRKNEDLNEFAPEGWDKDNGCDPTFYSDVEKLKKVADVKSKLLKKEESKAKELKASKSKK